MQTHTYAHVRRMFTLLLTCVHVQERNTEKKAFTETVYKTRMWKMKSKQRQTEQISMYLKATQGMYFSEFLACIVVCEHKCLLLIA